MLISTSSARCPTIRTHRLCIILFLFYSTLFLVGPISQFKKFIDTNNIPDTIMKIVSAVVLVIAIALTLLSALLVSIVMYSLLWNVYVYDLVGGALRAYRYRNQNSDVIVSLV